MCLDLVNMSKKPKRIQFLPFNETYLNQFQIYLNIKEVKLVAE